MDRSTPTQKKYVCTPCSNGKGLLRDLIGDYGAWEKSGIGCGGPVELIVNGMTDLKNPSSNGNGADA